MRSIYEFVDPVEFMRVRKIEMGLTLQIMADKAGLKAKSFFFKILERSKVYTMERVVPIGLMLNVKGKRQLEYFELMTFLHRAHAPLLLREKILKKFRPKKVIKYKKER